MTAVSRALVDAAAALAHDVDEVSIAGPVAHTLNPLRYAWPMHRAYLERFATTTKRAVFVGMNPGPFGMMQTGVPFGAVSVVRDWLALDAPVDTTTASHPRRPIEGLACTREEVSGARLWGLFRDRFGTPDAFFAEHFVANWCPLAFLDEGGRNVTPDKLAKTTRAALYDVCDRHLARVLEILAPRFVVGVGALAAARARGVVDDAGPRVVELLHPSPASPKANRGFADAARATLVEHGVWRDEGAQARRARSSR